MPAFFKTTAFKLTIIYMVVFVVFSIAVVLYIGFTVRDRLKTQLDETIASEIIGFSGHYERRGIRGLLEQVQNRVRQPGAPALLVTNFQGVGLSGNIPQLPPDFLSLDRGEIHALPYDRAKANGDVERTVAMVKIIDLPGGFNLVIGQDVAERDEFARIISGFVFIMLGALMLLGLLSWYLVGRRALRRIDMMSAASRKIVAGNLSERLAVDGSGDEFDRLAGNVNNLLDRIEALMLGLKDVSDNIAHDLKTPLTRMRNKVETALSDETGDKSGQDKMRGALEGTIVECDHLIRTFDALLRIARVEAGANVAIGDSVDAGQVVADVVELYEPVAEENGIGLQVETKATNTEIKGSRELIGQAIANLIDNALKYGGSSATNGSVLVSLKDACQTLEISVHDQGPGIAAKDHDEIIKRFSRLDESRSKPGSGLGLSLVAAVAKLHGGKLTFADNEPGLIVTLALPRKAG